MESLLSSFLLVVASEMGDKTQLLALVLAARFRQRWAIMAGILVATLANHGLAAGAGSWAAEFVDREVLRWALVATFVGFAAWILVPDKDEGLEDRGRWGAFFTTTAAFFLAEMGDKTQLATIALGARFQSLILVTIGTTLGMLVADGVAVFFGERILRRVPMVWVRRGAAVLFLVFGAFIAVKF